MNNYKTQW